MFAPLVPSSRVLFVSASSVSCGATASYDLRSRVEPVRGCRSVTKCDMRFNDATPRIRVDPESYTVEADGEVCRAAPAENLPLAQQWFVY